MVGTRLNLQPVNSELGLPPLPVVDALPGLAGARHVPADGSVVLVAFVEGNPAMPYVLAYEQDGGGGFVPLDTSIEASRQVYLGGRDGSVDGMWPAARVGDYVECLMPPAVPVSGTLMGAPFSGLMTIVDPIVGVIASGATRTSAK
jgi:hypothetical protein